VSLLKNKIAVVTGGSSGIGLATAKRFVEEGAYVFIAGRRQAELDKAVAEIGSNVTGVKTDIAKLDDLDRLYETVAKKGKIDVIFAGAAFVEKTMTAAATPEHFDKTFNTNARGTKRPGESPKGRASAGPPGARRLPQSPGESQSRRSGPRRSARTTGEAGRGVKATRSGRSGSWTGDALGLGLGRTKRCPGLGPGRPDKRN
jgi:NAD(P)-dependent dehydrogenase (short-subunit alcohol dehydrogenase family)